MAMLDAPRGRNRVRTTETSREGRYAPTTVLAATPAPWLRWARALLAAIAIATTIQAATAQDTLEDGLAAYRSGDYLKAVEVWRALAEKGDVLAQFRLGSMYAEGKGVAQDDVMAMMWFQRSANHGNAQAQYNVGASYAEGAGVAKDDDEAAKWFRRAAEQGMAYAQLNLGLLYASGRGVPQDNIEAMKWLGLAVIALPPGGPRSDAARAMQDVADKISPEESRQARERVRMWKATPEGK
jgi:TPR repeat protein